MRRAHKPISRVWRQSHRPAQQAACRMATCPAPQKMVIPRAADRAHSNSRTPASSWRTAPHGLKNEATSSAMKQSTDIYRTKDQRSLCDALSTWGRPRRGSATSAPTEWQARSSRSPVPIANFILLNSLANARS